MLRRSARRRQDVARPVDRPRDEPEVRAHLARRRPRRSRNPRPPPDLHRRHSRPHRPGAEAGRRDEPGVHARRDRQGQRRRFQGDPAAALLEVLDPAQNHAFRDHYLEINVDLSRVLFIATANQLGTIHPALLDRMEIISLVGYTRRGEGAHRAALSGSAAAGGAWADAGAGHGRRRRVAPDHRATTRARPACASLERQIGAVRAQDRRRASPASSATDAAASGYVGDRRRPARLSRAAAVPRRGRVPGVAARRRDRRRVDRERRRRPVHRGEPAAERSHNIILTGQLGNVMQESARAAVSHIRVARQRSSASRREFLDKHDLHVHVPAGAIPKDGPSAGVTMATAIVSALRNQPVREDVAMTGEITLSGLVLPVGGIREKALAARRHGIKTSSCRRCNAPDLAELPPKCATPCTSSRSRPWRRCSRWRCRASRRHRRMAGRGPGGVSRTESDHRAALELLHSDPILDPTVRGGSDCRYRAERQLLTPVYDPSTDQSGGRHLSGLGELVEVARNRQC